MLPPKLERMTGIWNTHRLDVKPRTRLRPRQNFIWFAASLVAVFAVTLRAAEPSDIQRGLLAGNYAAVIKQATGELRDAPANS